jgi:catechol 2,3-dioxygenase-like lactoylglutathione lyase family enzyme
MPLTGHATVLLVEDVRKTTDYYRDALGFDVELYDRIPDHYGYARREGCQVHFAHFDGVSARPNSEVVPPDMFDAYFWVDDVERMYADVVERGARSSTVPSTRATACVSSASATRRGTSSPSVSR